MKRTIAPIISNEEVMPAVHLLWAQAPEIAGVARPGQFVMVKASKGHDPLLRRPMSIHRVDGGAIALLVEVVGRGTGWLAQRTAGDAIDILGPLGNGFEVSSERLLLVAGGVGIAPLIFLAEKALADGRDVKLLNGARTADLLYPHHLLPQGIETDVITEDGSSGGRGVGTDLLADFTEIFVDAAVQLFACGPVTMYQAMANLDSLNGKSVQVSMEARMGCGFGGCCGCATWTRQGPRLVCRDGPVFELADLLL